MLVSPLFRETINFWFNSDGHLRSPFRLEWRPQVESSAAVKFQQWLSGLKEDAQHSVNDVIMSEKLEEIIFGCAMELALEADDRITILYPFLPRLGDPIGRINGSAPDSVVSTRSIEKRGEDRFMRVTATNDSSGEVWHTEFELP